MAGEQRAWDFIIRVDEVAIDYATAALLVIDLQVSFASRSHGAFRRLAEAGLAHEAEYAISRIESVVIPNVRDLARAFRVAGRPVVFARSASRRGDGTDQTARHRAQGLVIPEWAPEAQIVPQLAPKKGDIVLIKTGSGCFTSTNLDHLLRCMGVRALVLGGMWTNSCVETTARHAGDLDYEVVLVHDACVAMTPENHEHALRYLDRNFAQVCDSARVIDAVSATASRPGSSSPTGAAKPQNRACRETPE